ncbi:MAG: threonine/serine exporter family protein, partial [Oscillospiraceae bacterium]|nr:threonine/serine exporter family protein [Oscillospiraceae bacterium]
FDVISDSLESFRFLSVMFYMTGGLMPLGPGAGIYYTMEYALQGETQRFLEQGMLTLGAAVCLAAGVLVVSSAVRIFYMVSRRGKKSARP